MSIQHVNAINNRINDHHLSLTEKKRPLKTRKDMENE